MRRSAGQGIATTPVKQKLVTVLMAASSLVPTALIGTLLFGWAWRT